MSAQQGTCCGQRSDAHAAQSAPGRSSGAQTVQRECAEGPPSSLCRLLLVHNCSARQQSRPDYRSAGAEPARRAHPCVCGQRRAQALQRAQHGARAGALAGVHQGALPAGCRGRAAVLGRGALCLSTLITLCHGGACSPAAAAEPLSGLLVDAVQEDKLLPPAHWAVVACAAAGSAALPRQCFRSG